MKQGCYFVAILITLQTPTANADPIITAAPIPNVYVTTVTTVM
jgi:hypothetical protein